MRRSTTILTACLAAAAGCWGGGAQEPYDGLLAAAKRPAKLAAIRAPQVPEGEVIASELDVPWTIALLSSAKTGGSRKVTRAIVADAERDERETTVPELELHVAAEPRQAEGRPEAAKTCSGVVNRRS